jgi:signal transduction histidine kinase
VETRAVAAKPPRRTLWAAVVMTCLLAAMLGAYFTVAWRENAEGRAQLVDMPRVAANAQAQMLARELRGELEALIARESERGWSEYGNLYHSEGGTAAWNVEPSPLARGPQDPLVAGYFQIDARGRVTTPTVNDELPALSEPTHLAEHEAFRDAVARELAASLSPKHGELVAQAGTQVIHVDANSYAQNKAANAVYTQNPPRIASGQPVAVTVSVPVWKTLKFGGAPALVAVRRVDTPDGALAQGFVVDRATLTGQLAARAGDQVGELHAGGPGVEIAPGWELSVAPNPHEIARALAEASAVARGFVIRFAAIALLAVLAAGLVVLLVARAEGLARERSHFAAAAAHELRTPLAGLQLYGDMLADGLGDPDKLRDYARRMSEEASRLGRVVSNVLGFSQLERGNLSVDASVGPLGEALRELAEHAQPALDRAGAALALDVSPELRARFDRDALARVVGNLLDNAEKYARGADDRTIALAAHDLGDRVEVTVGDRGPGVADATRLFRPFARGADADVAGLGLGLALSRSLAQAMGGNLAYRAGEGGGAIFVLTLPRA